MHPPLAFSQLPRIVAAAVLLFQPALGSRTAPLAYHAPGDPIPDIDVTLTPTAAGRIAHLISDSNGAFAFSVPAGTYVLTIGAGPAVATANTRRAAPATASGVVSGALLALPELVTGRGGWPYRLRLDQEGLAVTHLGLVPVASNAAGRIGQPPTSRALEIQLTVGSSAQPAARYSVRGRVEARQ